LLEVLEPSADRVEPICPLVGRCGGCPLMPLHVSSQRELKRRMVSQAAGVEAILSPAGDSTAYRRRARLCWWTGRGGPALGYRERRSRTVVYVPRCPVLARPLQHALERVREALGPVLSGQGEILLALGTDEHAVVAVRTPDAQPTSVYQRAEGLANDPAIAGVALRAAGATSDARWGDPTERFLGPDGEVLEGTVAGFSQAHDDVSRALSALVVDLAEPREAHVLELYAGHGNLTIMLAREAKSQVAVERDPAAAEACLRNLRRRGHAQATVLEGSCEDHVRGRRVDVVVLDPPRTGALGILEDLVRHRRPRRIVYVSCDPPTLGRDLGRLKNLGYQVDSAFAFDMFPHTAHVEAVVRLNACQP
jgi:23S rRNA (uracil1939-C5)-methyltransferase